MSGEDNGPKSAKITQEEFDVLQNRIQAAIAKREALVKSWTASSSRKEPRKTDEQLDAEDASLFRNEPPYLGVGAPIPSHFLVSDAERNNKSLRAKFFPIKGLKGSKPRDSEEKAASAKRAKNDQSSDEEGGRSSLGKAKKVKITKAEPAQAKGVKTTVEHKANEDKIDVEDVKSGVTKEDKQESRLETPPITSVKDEPKNEEGTGRAIHQKEIPKKSKKKKKKPYQGQGLH